MSPVWSATFDATGTYPNDGFIGSPAIGSDGTVYIAGAFPDSSGNRRLYALNGSTGAILANWPLSLGSRLTTGNGLQDDKGIESTAAIGPDGMLYIGSWNYNIYKINPTTRAITTWTPTGTQPKGVLRSSPVVYNGYLFCWVSGDPLATTPHPHLVVLNASTMAYVASWLDTGVYGEAISSPALGRDQKIYLCTHFTDGSAQLGNTEQTGRVYAVDVSTPTSPTKLWEYPTGCIGPIIASPIIAADGKLYIGTQDGLMSGNTHAPVIICFDPSAAQPQVPLWTRTSFSRGPDGTPAIGRTGDIYVANDPGQLPTSLSAMYPRDQIDGGDYTADWDVETDGKLDSSPVVTSDETIYAKSVATSAPFAATLKKFADGAELDSVSLGNDTMAWHFHRFVGGGISTIYSSPAIAPNGKLYVAIAGNQDANGVPTGGGAIKCFATATTRPGFWPNFRGNRSNTGNVQDSAWTVKPAANMTASIFGLYSYPTSGENKAYSANNVSKIVGYIPYNGHYAACNWPDTSGSFPSRMTYWSGMGFYYTYVASGLNDLNNSVGSQIILNGSVYNLRATHWDTLTSTPTELARPSGFTDAEAYEIATPAPGLVADTTFIVGTGTNSSAKSRAMRWRNKDDATSAINLGTLDPSTASLQSFGYGINVRGWAVGKSQAFANGVYHAFATPPTRAINSTDNLSPFGTGDGPYSEAHSINGLGQIAGTSEAFPSTPQYAYIWYVNLDGTISIKDLRALNNGNGTAGAFCINNRGQVVGWARRADATLTSFIWVPGWTDMRDLKTLLSTTDQNNWSELTAATAITDDGVIVGYGKQTGVSYYTGFVIKPNP